MRSTTACYGNLSVPASARRDVDAAFRYLAHDPGERRLIDRLEHGCGHYRLVVNARDNDCYDPDRHAIHWDPHSALRTSTGGRQSPALGLGHEIDHAVESPARLERLTATPDRRYDDREERRVVTGSERHAARALGEDVRHDHGGTTYRVASPLAR